MSRKVAAVLCLIFSLAVTESNTFISCIVEFSDLKPYCCGRFFDMITIFIIPVHSCVIIFKVLITYHTEGRLSTIR